MKLVTPRNEIKFQVFKKIVSSFFETSSIQSPREWLFNCSNAWHRQRESIFSILNCYKTSVLLFKFSVYFIEKIENLMPLIDKKELKKEVIYEADWLLKSDFVFKISDKIFPYV